MKTSLSTTLSLALTLSAAAQTAPTAPTPAPPSVPAATPFWDVLSDPGNLATVAVLAAGFSYAKTDWHYTLRGKEYTLTPAQQLGMETGIVFAAMAAKHYFPKTRTPINVVLGVVAAYFAGQAYANTINHGAPSPAVPAASISPKAAFAVRVRLPR